MKFYLTIGISALIHLLVIYLFSRPTLITVPVEPVKAVVKAQLIFAPPKPQIQQELPVITETKPEIVKPITPEPKVIAEQPTVMAAPSAIKTTAPAKVEVEEKLTANPTTSTAQPFDLNASISSLISENEQSFFDSVSNQTQPQPSYRSINSTNPNAADQSNIKAIFETAARIDPDTRVVNYNGSCVQIKRVLDHNGFSQFSWQGTTLKCGKDDEVNKQLKLSLSKFLKR